MTWPSLDLDRRERINGVTVSEIVSGVGGITRTGTGVLALSGASTYGGNTTASGGIIAYTTNAAIAGYSTSPATAFGTFVSPRNSAASGSIVSLPFGGANLISTTDIAALLDGATYNVFAAGSSWGIDTTQAAGSLVGTVITNAGSNSIGFAKTGANNLTLGGTVNTYTGPTSNLQGSLSVSAINNAASTGPLGQNSTISLGYNLTTGTLLYTGAGETTDRVINLNGNVASGGVIDNQGAGTLTFSNPMTLATGTKTLTLTGATNTSNITFGSPIVGTISTGTNPLTIVKSGTNTVTLAATASTATTLTVSGGTFNTGAGGLTLGNVGAATINTTGATANTTVFVSGKITLTGVATAAANGADIGAIANVTLDLTNTVIEGSTLNTNVDFNPAGTVLLGNLNTYTGQSHVNGSTPVVTSFGNAAGSVASSLGQPATGNSVTGNLYSTVLLSSGTLRYAGTGETTDRALDLRGTTATAILEQSGASGNLKFTGANTATGVGSKVWTLQGSTAGTGEIAGVIENNPTVGSTLSAAFASGDTTVTLNSVDGVSVGAAISGTGLAAGTTITAINTGTRVVTLSTAATGTGAANASLTVAGVVNSTGILKSGTGTWTLSGTNTYTGPTTVSAGNLILTTGTTNNSVVTVNNGSILSVAGNYTVGNTLATAAGGRLTVAAGGVLNLQDGAVNTLTLSQGATFSGAALALNGGTLRFDVGATSDQISVTGPATATASGLNYIAINGLSGILAAPTNYTLITANSGSLADANFALASNVINVGGTPYSLSLGGTTTTRVLTVSPFVTSAPASAFWNGTTNASWNTQAGGVGTGGARTG